MNIDKIFENNKEWVRKHLEVDENYFDDLSEGQNPEVLYIGCSDSRVTTEQLMGAKPGEVFVYRNIANMVSSLDFGAMSVIQYAVEVLKVKHITVVGHYQCGGVQAAMKSKDYGLLNPWFRSIRDVYRHHEDELDSISDEKEKYDRLVELNVKEQCINVLKTSIVQKAFRKKEVKVHGWVWDIHSGLLKDLNIDFEKVLEHIMKVYHLD